MLDAAESVRQADVAHVTHNRGHFAVVAKERQVCADEMHKMMDELSQTCPVEVVTNIKTETVVSMMLHKQHEIIEHMLHEGAVNEADGAALIGKIDKQLETLHAKAAKLDIFKKLKPAPSNKVSVSD